MGLGFNMENCPVVEVKGDQVAVWTVGDVRPGPSSSDRQEVNRRFQFHNLKELNSANNLIELPGVFS